MQVDLSQLLLVVLGSVLTLAGTLLVWILNNINERRKERAATLEKLLQPAEDYLVELSTEINKFFLDTTSELPQETKINTYKNFANILSKMFTMRDALIINGVPEIYQTFNDELRFFVQLSQLQIFNNAKNDEEITESYKKIKLLQATIFRKISLARINGIKIDEFVREED